MFCFWKSSCWVPTIAFVEHKRGSNRTHCITYPGCCNANKPDSVKGEGESKGSSKVPLCSPSVARQRVGGECQANQFRGRPSLRPPQLLSCGRGTQANPLRDSPCVTRNYGPDGERAFHRVGRHNFHRRGRELRQAPMQSSRVEVRKVGVPAPADVQPRHLAAPHPHGNMGSDSRSMRRGNA